MPQLSGTWVHPADGDQPTELRMKVSESSALGITTWQTEIDYGRPFGVSTWRYIFPSGSRHIMFTVLGKDEREKWSPLSTMADKWSVPGGNLKYAREVMHRFFTEAGYTKIA